MKLNYIFFPVCFLIAACGGGGEGASIDLSLPLTGILVDSPVSGVAYTSPSRSGTTQPDGGFFYMEGDVVTFSLGATQLGSATGRPQVSPVELAGLNALPVGNAAISEVIDDESSAFQATINLAVLLQTFDADGDPENGIEITTEIAGLFDGVELNIQQHHSVFGVDSLFKSVLESANDSGVFDSNRTSRNAALALDHLYETLEIAPARSILGTRQSDFDADGDVDYLVEFKFDAAANVVIAEARDSAGNVDLIYKNHYDEQGNRVRFDIDYDGDGDPDSSDLYSFDDNRNLIGLVRDTDGDDLADFVLSNELDEYGRVVRSDSDSNADGIIDTISSWEYDQDGNAILFEQDRDADGEVDFTRTAEYDDEGKLTRQVSSDGTSSRVTVFAYDSEGNRTLTESDNDGDNVPESVITNEFEEGNLTQTETDDDNDGAPNLVSTFIYDDDENLTRLSRFDGSLTPTFVETYEYDDSGNVTRRETDSNGDGSADRIVAFQYDSSNRLISVEADNNADGSVDQIDTRTYQEVGWWAYETLVDMVSIWGS